MLANLARCRDEHGNGARFNLGGYCSQTVDWLTAAALVEPDANRRDALMFEAFGTVHEDAGFIPLYQQTLAWAMPDRVATAPRVDNQIRFAVIQLVPPATARRPADVAAARTAVEWDHLQKA